MAGALAMVLNTAYQIICKESFPVLRIEPKKRRILGVSSLDG